MWEPSRMTFIYKVPSPVAQYIVGTQKVVVDMMIYVCCIIIYMTVSPSSGPLAGRCSWWLWPFLSSCHCTHLHCGTLFLAILSCSLVLFYKVKWQPQVFSIWRAKSYGGSGLQICVDLLVWCCLGALQVRTWKKHLSSGASKERASKESRLLRR